MNKTLEIIHNSDVDQFVGELKLSEIDYFSLSIVKNNKVFSIISLDEWKKFYVSRQCFNFDPLIACALAIVKTPIDWKSVNINKKKEIHALYRCVVSGVCKALMHKILLAAQIDDYSYR